MVMPTQKPGKSNQSVQTPNDLMNAIHELIGDTFAVDLAADETNRQAPTYIGEEENSLTVDWHKLSPGRWLWLNPPYKNIYPWVSHANIEGMMGAKIAMLVPASVGSSWWVAHVHGAAQVYFLNPRVTFVGHTSPYPKDLALLCYRRGINGGYNSWRWKA